MKLKQLLQKMKIKRDIKNLRFDLIDNNPDFIWKEYRKHGEYQALVWLKAYTENRAASSPRKLVISMLEKINRESNDSKDDALFALTLMRYI
jgi:hypothetical protein